MGQINSTQDGSTASNVSPPDQKDADSDDTGDLSEKVRCVKTRIDMLIEDCLNSKDDLNSNSSDTKGVNENTSEESAQDKEESVNEVISVSDDKKSENEVEDKHKVETLECCKEDETSSVKKSDSEKSVSKLDLSDIIKDSVNTELTQTQLRQIQQRTITTFNTFIDKVLDNSLNKELAKDDTTKKSDILRLCSESMKPSEENSEKKAPTKNKPEQTVKNDESGKKFTEKSMTLKEHIEKFLEMSFKEDIFEDDHKKTESKVSLPENFNAQGLVNSMITQGLQINRLLTNEKPKVISSKASSQKEEDKNNGRSVRVNEGKQQTVSIMGQKSPGMRPYSEVNDRRNSQDFASHQMADSRMREQYLNASKVDVAHRMNLNTVYRNDEMMDRSRDVHSKMPFDGVGMVHAVRAAGHVSAHMPSFHHPQHLQMGNNAYLHPAYGSRVQVSPGRREMKSPVGRDGKIHPRDCGCQYCMQMSHNLDIPMSEHHHSGKHSPIVAHSIYEHGMAVQAAISGHLREVPASMVKPVGDMTHAMPAYHGMHKYMPHHSPAAASKNCSTAPHLVHGDISSHGMAPGCRPGLHDSGPYLHPQRHGENISPAERVSLRSGKRSPYQVRPSSVPSQEHSSRPGSGHRASDNDFLRSSDSLSGASDCSNEAPLDLTVKKPKIDSMRNRSASNGNYGRKINPSVTFLRHLESSVDKHLNEMSCSPPSSPGQGQAPGNRPKTPNNGRNSTHMYPRQSPSHSPPSGMVNMLSNRQLRSPHFVGGITVGQPLVDIKPLAHQTQTQHESQYSSTSQTVPHMTASQAQTQQQHQGYQSNADLSSKRNQSNNVSKHEPIQNIIGSNDPNDILYLICRLCTQTYGSPYGFRKHFRNQHGFEPRAEHTIVQTISATKTALHLPQPQTIQGMATYHESQNRRKSMSPEEGSESSKISVGAGSVSHRDSPASFTDSRSNAGSEEGDKIDVENSETKCLECPECGKTFQLNDFGSYKRHCRHHGSVKMNGPFTCSDCHLPFPDQKLLREHYISHVKDGAMLIKQEKAGTDGGNPKTNQAVMKCYACVKCDVQFENIESYTHHMNRHSFESDCSSWDKSNSSKSEQKVTMSVNSEKDSSLNIITSTNITIQAAESMTTLVCPDSSWDNVTKAAATSNRMESTNSEVIESGHSNMSNSSDQCSTVKKEMEDSVNLFRQRTLESGSDTNEDKNNGNDEFMYKHKKFFHHRKRANSNVSVESTGPKQTKMSRESSQSSLEELSVNPSHVTDVGMDTCETAGGAPKPGVEESEKKLVKAEENNAKTEARHSSLPFVWDRTVRNQRKT